jgi:hypothetical protein
MAKTVAQFAEERGPDLQALLAVINEDPENTGQIEDVEQLMAEMLEDVIDVYIDRYKHVIERDL